MAKLTNITVYGDKYPQVSHPYWHAKADSDLEGWHLELMSNSNSSHGEHMLGDYFTSLICAVFNNEVPSIPEPDKLVIEFTGQSFGKQSGARYMSPANEGSVYLTVRSKGVKQDGWYCLKTVKLKFFLSGHGTKEQFSRAVESLLTPKALTSYREAFDVQKVA